MAHQPVDIGLAPNDPNADTLRDAFDKLNDNDAELYGRTAAATETASGIVELATTAEATTGTDPARAVTPVGLKAHVDAAIAAIRNGVSASFDTLVEIAAQLTVDKKSANAAQMTMANSWTVTGGFDIVSRKTGKKVHFSGLASAGTLAAGTTMFTLPSGHAPVERLIIPCMDNAGTLQFIRVIEAAGAVQTQAITGSPTWLAFSHSFNVD